ncbi:hypothetical protein AB0M95_22170 [Sphaerisporangium sp. NPDC051017]|uniref:hypothetical protein n=1 Tax=Sphaerisporangium sp. NPDC051017 TaxID=3154636 RepID=UPI00342AAA93
MIATISVAGQHWRYPQVDVVAYVDGFNLYHGLKSKYGRAYLWLDLVELIRQTRRHDVVIKVRYFTAIVRGEPDAALRQETYLGALAASHPELEIVRGHFKRRPRGVGIVALDGHAPANHPRSSILTRRS